MRKFLIALLLLCGVAQAKDAAIRNYELSYRKIAVGTATLAEAVQILGEPRSKKVNSNNVRYRFGDVDITIKDASGLVDSIIIHDPSFRDVNGYTVGTELADVERTTGLVRKGDSLFDQTNGVVYWFKNGRVSQIVYLAKARVR